MLCASGRNVLVLSGCLYAACASVVVEAYVTSLKAAGSRPNDVNDFFSIYLFFPAALDPLTEISTRSRKIMFLEVESGRCVRLTNLPPSLSRMSGQCGILNI
jgi:hypothetical protein